MKRLFTLLLIALTTLSCEVIDEKLDDLLDKRDWVVFADGTELTVDVPSKQTVLNYKFESTLDWELTTESEWLEIDPTSGKAGKDIKIKIKVLHNKDKEGRTGYVDLTLSNSESYRITVNQAGEGEENDDIIVDIPNNEIWYTSTDGEIVKPYSGEYNNNADAPTTFGVNIVSNTYKDGKGVITFDGDVATIGDWAFYGFTSLTSITIPNSVTTIGDYAFAVCYSLTSITIPGSVTEIGDCAFQSCTSLTSFYGKFASVDNRCLIANGKLIAFAPAGLTEYTIPDSVTEIGYMAFAVCYSLTNITIPDSVTSIGDYAFCRCTSLASVTIPDSVTEIGEWAFGYCTSLTSVTIPDSVTEIGNDAFYNCTSIASVTIPDSVTTIGDYAFRSCSSLASATIGNSVTEIGYCAFYDCTSLTSVTIPDSVTEIGNAAFSYCTSLTSFFGKFASVDNRCLIVNGELVAFAPAGLTEYTIPDSVTEIGGSAFNYCRSLTSVTIPDSVTSIGEWAFRECYSLASFYGKFASVDNRCLIANGKLIAFAPAGLTEYTIPDSVTEIGYYAFDYCYSLTNITIPDSVTSIGVGAFCRCPSLASVTIPDSVTEIREGAFEFCTSLTSVYCKPTTPPTGDSSMFDYNPSGRKIYVPAESVEAYKTAEGWKDYASDIVGYNF